ncbi:MAG: hypothetical protein J6I50_01010 [Clostridia bacterium]|nr:hypothetical protein [Clostridia bacterium]
MLTLLLLLYRYIALLSPKKIFVTGGVFCILFGLFTIIYGVEYQLYRNDIISLPSLVQNHPWKAHLWNVPTVLYVLFSILVGVLFVFRSKSTHSEKNEVFLLLAFMECIASVYAICTFYSIGIPTTFLMLLPTSIALVIGVVKQQKNNHAGDRKR